MELSPNQLAGVVALFGALTREELRAAVEELAFKDGTTVEDEAFETTLRAARERHVLVGIEQGDTGDVLVTGPAAFPELPDHAEDLPHILEVEARSVEVGSVAEALRDELLEEATAVTDPDRRERLWELSYDLESWGSIDAGAVREALEGTEADED